MRGIKQIVLLVVSLVIVLIFMFPFYWMLITSIKPISEVVTSPPIFIPRNPTLDAYYTVFTKWSMGRYLLNSFIIAFPTTVITITLGVMAAYGLARFQIKGLRIFLLVLLVSMLLPDVSLVLPLFMIFSKIGLLDKFHSVILADVMLQLPFVILILRPYFSKIPKTLEEAARIDGCSFLSALLRIIIPLALPGIITAAILTFLFTWGEFTFALTFLSRSEMQPITIGIYNTIGQYGIRYNLLMANSMIAIMPVVLIFIFFQRYIRGGLMVGGLKE
jgi:multiple sugar transport system permease protein